MVLSMVACNRLGQEGLESNNIFSNFNDDQIYQAIKKMRTYITGVAAVLGKRYIVVAPRVATISQCIVSTECSFRLKVTSLAFHYYRAIGRGRTPTNLKYTQVLRNFYI